MALKEIIIGTFTNKWQYKLAAIAAAFILWFYVAKDQSFNIIVNAPLEFSNYPVDMKMINNVKSTVKVTLAGRRDIVTRIHKNEIKILIDLKNAKPGENIYRINADNIKAIPRGVDISDLSPYQIEVVLKPEIRKK